MWMAIAVTATIIAIGNVLFGHFEEHTSKWRRVTKIIVVLAVVGAIASRFGAMWGLFPVALMLVAASVIHLWWLPRHGIHGLTGEPKEKYYALRGWKTAVVPSSKEK